MIEIKSISKSYGQTKAVADVSFQVDSGEVVGLLGPNGAGKTTILNMITGVLLPDQGTIEIDRQPLNKHELYLKQNLGYLAEDNPLYTNLLVSESLKLAAELKGLEASKYQSQLAEVIESTGIGSFFNQPIEMLSKGMRQRVGLAQVLIGRPKILILDEPTEGLDPNQRQEIRNLISKLGQEHTVLLSTHVMQEVEAICQRVIILNQGKVVAAGSVEEIIHQQSDQSGSIEVEIAIAGRNADRILDLVKTRFNLINHERECHRIQLSSENINEFYALIAENTSGDAYITRLSTVQANLEDIFRKLTLTE